MISSINRMMLVLFSVSMALLGLHSRAQAGLLVPNGNPTGAASADGGRNPFSFGYYTVSLSPSTALYTNQAWATTALNAQGMNSANGWNISFFMPNGDYRLDTYEAWTETSPAVTEPTISVQADSTTYNGSGGAALGLHYTGTDSEHWMQVIRTNSPDDTMKSYSYTLSSDPGFYYYIDDKPGLAVNNPFYDYGYAATATDFIDRPARGYSSTTVWQAQAFIAQGSWDPNTGEVLNKTLKIGATGVEWGFDDPFVTPEPSALALLVCGCVTLLSSRVLQKRARRGRVCA